MTLHVSHFVRNGELQTAYNDVGGGDNTPFVLVHGFTGSKLDFANQISWFSDDRRVISFDQRGHGETTNSGPYDLYTLAGDLLRFLDAVEIAECHILGHSLGGMVVMRALLSAPDRIRSAILMDTAPAALNLIPAKIRAQLNTLVEQGGCAALLDGMRGQPQNASVQRGISYLGEQEHWRRIHTKLEQMDPQAFVELGNVLADHPAVTRQLSSLTMPTTIIVGADDSPFLQPSREMAKQLPQSQLQIVPNAGHSPQYENHLAWRDAIEAHLAQF